MESGKLSAVLQGYAGTPAAAVHNQDLVQRQFESVKRVLRDFVGSNTQFTEFNHSKLEARTVNRVEARQSPRLRMEVTYYGKT